MDRQRLKLIAEKILSQVPNPPESFGSVIAVLMIISIVLTLIRVIQECRKANLQSFGDTNDRCIYMTSEINNLSFKRTWFTKRTIKKLLKKELSSQEYKEYGIPLMNAILLCGSTLSNEETLTLMEAANV
jgi:hypothetical protein